MQFFKKCLQILWNPLQIFSTELQNSLRYSAGQGLITCIIRTLYLTTKFILQQHYIAKVLFQYTCCGAGRGVCQGVVDTRKYTRKYAIQTSGVKALEFEIGQEIN